MKPKTIYRKLLPALFILIALTSRAQQQFTHTAAKENISCNYDCTMLDVAELNNNGAAVIFVIPVSDKEVTLNQHPIGAYYFKEKWHIFNLDSRPIPVGSKFTVTYFTNPDEKHFQYSFRREDIQADGSALIDHPLLNNDPSAKFSSFPRWDPNSQGGITNRDEIKTEYNAVAGKWSFSNKNQKPLFARVTYNISISGPGRVNTQIPRASIEIKELTVTPNANKILNPVGFMFMAVWADGIKLPGENVIATHSEQTELIGFETGTSNIDSRKNSYQAITIKFNSGVPAFISLLNAFIKKQSMVFTIDAISNSNEGKQELNYTIKLTGAYISSYKQIFDTGLTMAAGKNQSVKGYDEIKIMFTNIEITNSAGATAKDNQ
jgi:type VI protein secretion system component Hcp